MKTILAITGGVFWLLAILGAVVPGWNFHAVFADDESARDWHSRKAAELDARIQAKADQTSNETKP